MPERERGQSVEHMLRQVFGRDTPAPADVCLDGETVAAWMSGTLHGAEAAAAETHLANCTHCQALVAAVIRTTPEPSASVPLWRRWHLRWAVPLATAATAVAIWIATPGSRPPPPRESEASRAAARSSAAAPQPSAAPPPAAASPELESARARPPATLQERDAVSQDGQRPAAPSRLALEDRAPVAAGAPAAAAAREEVVELKKAEPSAAQFRASAPSVPAFIEVTSPGETSRWRITNGRKVEWISARSTVWQSASIDNAEQLSAGAAPSSTVCWLVGLQGAVFLSTDGSRFTRLPFPEQVDLVSVAAINDQTATVVAGDGRRWSTQDRGVTWTVTR